MYPSSTTATLLFNSSAQILNQVLSDSNEYVDITFSNGVYGNSSQSEIVGVSDVQVELNSNSGNATNVTVVNITTNLGATLT